MLFVYIALGFLGMLVGAWLATVCLLTVVRQGIQEYFKQKHRYLLETLKYVPEEQKENYGSGLEK